jgi:hypothetical protein
MKKAELEHLLRAAGGVARDEHFIVFGSEAIWGLVRRVPKELTTDLAYIRALLKHKLVKRTILEERLADTAIHPYHREELLETLRKLARPKAKRK